MEDMSKRASGKSRGTGGSTSIYELPYVYRWLKKIEIRFLVRLV